jgi:hypothetical protein
MAVLESLADVLGDGRWIGWLSNEPVTGSETGDVPCM